MQKLPQFTRSPMPGKRSSEVKARITDDLKFDLTRKCHELGITESDYIDRLLCVSLYGLESVLEMDRKKTTSIMGKLSDLWHKVGSQRSELSTDYPTYPTYPYTSPYKAPAYKGY
jgi:hypothetical protein